jgi:hypothetical protein
MAVPGSGLITKGGFLASSPHVSAGGEKIPLPDRGSYQSQLRLDDSNPQDTLYPVGGVG